MLYLVIATILFLILAIKRLDWAVLVIIAALPSYLIRFTVLGIPSTWLEIMVLIVAAVFVARNYQTVLANVKSKWQGRGLTDRYPFDWEMILWLVLALLAVVVAGVNQSALGIFKAYFFEPIAFFLIVVNVLGKKEENLPKIMWSLAISALAVSIIGWYQKFFDMQFLNPVWSHQSEPRITSFFPYANAVGLYLGPIIILLTAYLKKMNRRQYWRVIAMVLIIIMSLAAVYFAKSEGAMLGILVGLVILALGYRPWSTKLCMAAVIILIMALPQARAFVWQKLTLSDLSGEIRQEQWRETSAMLMTDPTRFIFGVGLSGFPAAVKPFHVDGIFFNVDNDPRFHNKVVFNAEYRANHWQPVNVYQYPHNILLNFWCELGLLGMALAVWLMIKFLSVALRIYRQHGDWLALGLLAAMSAWIIHGLVDVPYFKNDLAMLWWLMFALLAVKILHYERSVAKNNRD